MVIDRGERIRLGTASLAIGALLAGGYLAFKLFGMAAARKTLRHRAEKIHDKTLKESFPASDPPASQYFDIPVNRQ